MKRVGYVSTKEVECSREAVNRIFLNWYFFEKESTCKKGVFYYLFGSKLRLFTL